MTTHDQPLRHKLTDAEPLPHPVAAAAIYASLVGLSLGIGLALGEPRRWLVVATISLALAGIWHAGRSGLELARRRREADAWLCTIRRCSPSSRYAWRAEELTSRGERRLLARSLRRLVAELEGRVLPGPVPISRADLYPYASDLRVLADRLADMSRPVAPAGTVLLIRLLTEPVGPLYDRARADELPHKVASILAALEVD